MSRIVQVGKVGVGGGNPIRIQSMTTSPTSDVEATVEQILRLVDAGCEIVRVTVQGKKEALACGEIRNRLDQLGVDVPLVADIHFYPPAALLVADFVEKVRINPGNFVDPRATFRLKEYDDETYQRELDKIDRVFGELVDKCKKLDRAIRIGVNHGSLSDRIMNRYGDTPLGMVESAFEFAEVCRGRDFHNFLFSMKSSRPIIMVEAYRLLQKRQEEMGWDYPLHLGVTEAGEGEDGRIKSAVGIGTLLLEGIGDTIRVSLTEDPWEEIEPCKQLIAATEKKPSVPLAPLGKMGLVYTTEECGADGVLAPGEEIPGIYRFVSDSPDPIIEAAVACGSLLLDKRINGVCLDTPLSVEKEKEIAFGIMQALGFRTTKTEFISCPGCGRTLFDLQETSRRIREKTGHLPGVKIAIMGCIVNGPGEMADADFGYVGSKAGHIDLYVGKERVERNIPFDQADDRLIDLIKSKGLWVELSCTN